MADTNENLLKLAEQKFHSAAENIAKDLIANSFKKPQTNADRIRAMSDEELAEWLDSLRYGFGCELCEKVFKGCDENCRTHFMEWLKQPAEVER